jgi:hypothetical protein
MRKGRAIFQTIPPQPPALVKPQEQKLTTDPNGAHFRLSQIPNKYGFLVELRGEDRAGKDKHFGSSHSEASGRMVAATRAGYDELRLMLPYPRRRATLRVKRREWTSVSR